MTRAHLRYAAEGEEGASAVEYALLIALIALAIFGAVALLGTAVSGLFETVANTFP